MQIRYYLAASAAALSIATVVGTPAMAQQITTGIEGAVVNEAGEPVVGATVGITDTRTGSTRTITTGTNGAFSATGLETGGPYSVTVSADGFEGQTLEDVNTTLQGNTNLNFTLSSGAGEIIVSGTRVSVTQLATGPGQSFSTDVLDAAPTFERDIRDVLKIDPRVSLDRNQETDRISCLGGNDRGNTFTVDGISQSDIYGLNDAPFSTRSGTPVPYDAIRETSVEFAPFDVEYGQFTGCAINAVTKSGTNEIHGNAFFSYGDKSLAGDKVAGAAAAGADRDIRYGGTLGGPIIKDRLFIFGAYEHIEISDTQDDGPSGAGFPNERAFITEAQFNAISDVLASSYGRETGGIARSLPFTSDRYFVRGDAYITDDHRLAVTYQRVEEVKVRADDFSGSVVTGLDNFIQSGSQSNYYSGRLYSNWTDNFSTEIGYSRSDITDIQSPVGGGEAQDENPITRIVVGVQNGASQGLFVSGPGFSRSANRLETTVDQFKAKAELVAGSHTLTFGAELNRANLNNLFVQNATGTLYFRNTAALIAGTPNSGTGTNVTSASAVIAGTTYGADINASSDGNIETAAAAFRRDIWSIYAQDEWEAADRFTLTGGVRIDWYDGGRPRLNSNFVERYGFSNTSSFSNIDPIVMPRLGFRYDAGDIGFVRNARLTGGVGLFSGGDPVVWFGNAFQNNGFGFSQGTLTAANCGSASVNVLAGGTFTGVPACVVAAGARSAARGLGDAQSIDPDLKQPSVFRANLGLAARLGDGGNFFSGWNLNLDYIYSRYRNPLTIVDLSQIPDPRIGLNGFTIDGRPIIRAIDPTAAGCNAELVSDGTSLSYSGVTSACFNTSRDDELQLTNAGSYRTQIASIILSKQFDGGLITDGGSVSINAGYAYTDAQDRRSMYRSTAGSNFDGVAAFDRQNPTPSRGFFASKHNFTLSTQFKEQFFGEYDTQFGATFVARSGRPYSLTFGGSGAFYDSASGNDNALLYIPTGVTDPNLSPTSTPAAVQSLVDYVGALDCAKKYAGRTIERNTCENDWYLDLDLNFSQELPGPLKNGDSFRLSVTFDNFLNFLDDDWNVFRRRDFEGLVNVVNVPSNPVDAQGRYIISSFAPDDAEQVQTSSSLWRLKVGISYRF
jgi:Carboxypeptidase regulatory-like domain/TonB dependent receptor